MTECLIKNTLHGDTQSFAKIVDKYKDMVYTISIKILRNKEDAEEVAQDTFVKVYNSLKNFRKESKFSSWIYRIAYNTAISRVRKEKKKKADISLDDKEYIKDNITINHITKTLEPLEAEERHLYLHKAINSLSTNEQLAVNLFYLEEKSVKEIEEITSWSTSNVKTQLFRARKKLYNKLNQLLKNETKILQ